MDTGPAGLKKAWRAQGSGGMWSKRTRLAATHATRA